MTVEDTVTPSGATRGDARRPRRGAAAVARTGSALRFASGTVTAALVLLAFVVAAAALAAGDRPGPGAGAIAGHAAVAAAAVVLQAVADRRRGPVAVFAALLVFPLAAVALWSWWWG